MSVAFKIVANAMFISWFCSPSDPLSGIAARCRWSAKCLSIEGRGHHLEIEIFNN